MRPPAGSKVGERIYLEGNPENIDAIWSNEPRDELKKKKEKYLPALLEHTTTNGAKEATYHGYKMRTSAGVITCDTLANVKMS